MTFAQFVRVVETALARIPPSADGLAPDWNALLDNPDIRAAVGWEPPAIDDVTAAAGAAAGRIWAIRYDRVAGGVGLKHPVVAGLLVRAAVRNRRRANAILGIIDGGSVNTGLALGHFAKWFNLRAKLVMSSLFPPDIRDFLVEVSGGRLEVIQAPRGKEGREREFYRHLVRVMRDGAANEGYLALWHAKYGGAALAPLGRLIAAGLSSEPDYLVMTIGSGANLVGIGLPVQDRFAGRPRVVIVEPEASPLLQLPPDRTIRLDELPPSRLPTDRLRRPPTGAPHGLLGSHFDDLNPFLGETALRRINRVVRPTDEAWMQMSAYCEANGLAVGNSSAANLLVARHLAGSGATVLTFVYEPLRAFYKAPGADPGSRQEDP